jgi:hypothetical protein
MHLMSGDHAEGLTRPEHEAVVESFGVETDLI